MAASSRASRPSALTWLSLSSFAAAMMPSDEMVSFLEPGPKTEGPVGNAKNLPSVERANAPASLALLAAGLVSSNPTGIASTGGVPSGRLCSLSDFRAAFMRSNMLRRKKVLLCRGYGGSG